MKKKRIPNKKVGEFNKKMRKVFDEIEVIRMDKLKDSFEVIDRKDVVNDSKGKQEIYFIVRKYRRSGGRY